MAAGVGGAGFNDPPQRLRALAPPRRDSLDVGFLSTEQVGRRKPTFLERWTQSYTPQGLSEFHDRNWTSAKSAVRMRGP
jgi:hypothetical protein